MVKSIIIFPITIMVLVIMIPNILYKIFKCFNDRREIVVHGDIVVQGEIIEDV